MPAGVNKLFNAVPRLLLLLLRLPPNSVQKPRGEGKEGQVEGNGRKHYTIHIELFRLPIERSLTFVSRASDLGSSTLYVLLLSVARCVF